MTSQGDRLRRELLADALADAAQALRAGDARADALALHVLAFKPVREQWAKLAPLTVHPRDRAEARRILAGWVSSS